MKQPKIIFFDVDGTLLALHSKAVSDKTIEALLRLRERGSLLCIASGRSPVSIPKIPGVEFDAYLSCNGSYCYNHRETIYSNPIPKEDVKTVIRNCARMGKPVSIATKDRLAANGIEEDLAEYYRIAGLKLEAAADFDRIVEEEVVYQMMMGCRVPEFPDIMKDAHGARITYSWDRAADVIPASGGKGTGIRAILEYYGIAPEDAMAFGDGNNDLDMLQSVGMGIAMGNASAQLKEVAWDICGSVTDDGIYHYCVQNGLI